MTLALLASWTLRTSLILVAGLIAARTPRLSAATRHRVLATAVCAALLVPVARAVIPAWPIAPALTPTLPARPPASATGVIVGTTFVLPPSAPATQAAPRPSLRSQAVVALVGVLMTGALIRLTRLGIALARLRRIGRRAHDLASPVWAAELLEVDCAAAERGHIRLLQGDAATPVVTWGWRRPRILLPEGADTWSPARIRIVLAHECAHIARGDWPAQMAAECLRAVWWFNPLAWSVTARLRFEGERACDDRVVACGVRPTDYADHLVDLARVDPRQWPQTASAVAHPSTLERRISAMLDTRLPHGPMSRLARVSTTLCGLAATVFVASLTAQSAFGTLNGIVHDPLGGTIPKVTLTLTHVESGAKHEVPSAGTGRFEFVGLPAGNYTLEASVLGFRTYSSPLQIAAGGTLTRDLTLEVGQLQETITVRDAPPSSSGAPGSYVPKPQPACTTAPNSGGLRPPTKTHDVRPDYPGAHHASGAEAVVTLRAVISTDGTVGTVDTVDAPAVEFAESARDAVRQWRFTPTLLNCVPVEVQMNVSVLFKP